MTAAPRLLPRTDLNGNMRRCAVERETACANVTVETEVPQKASVDYSESKPRQRLLPRPDLNGNMRRRAVERETACVNVTVETEVLQNASVDYSESKPRQRKRSSAESQLSNSEDSRRCKIPAKDKESRSRPKVKPVQRNTAAPCADVLLSPVTQLGSIIADFVFPSTRQRCSSSSSVSSNSSSSSSDSGSNNSVTATEDTIVPVQTCQVETSQMFKATVMHPTTNFKWNASRPGPIRVSNDEGDYELYGWNLGNDTFVFGFKGNGTTWYVDTSSAVGSYLMLTNSGVDPLSIPDPSSDTRCILQVYSSITSQFHLQPLHDTTKWICRNGGYASLTDSAVQAEAWDVDYAF